MAEKKKLTTAHGNPVGDNQNSLTAGARGPLLMQDYQLLEKMGAKEILEKAGIILEDKVEAETDIENELTDDEDPIETKPLSELEEILAQAIANEDYELASQIRDEVKRRLDLEGYLPGL